MSDATPVGDATPKVVKKEPTATPRGVKISVSQIRQEHVDIDHRPIRPVFDGANAGSPFTGTVAQREEYGDHLDWPLVNTFPKPNVAYAPSITEITAFCPSYVVLCDYYKFWALASGMTARHDKWRLDFTKRHHIAGNFVPHGAAAVVRDKDNRLRFPVWDGKQFHGDVGERLHLKAKYSAAEFTILCAGPHAEVRTPTSTSYKTWCLGDYCPPQYKFPEDWDVLARLPPSNVTQANSLVVNIPIANPGTTFTPLNTNPGTTFTPLNTSDQGSKSALEQISQAATPSHEPKTAATAPKTTAGRQPKPAATEPKTTASHDPKTTASHQPKTAASEPKRANSTETGGPKVKRFKRSAIKPLHTRIDTPTPSPLSSPSRVPAQTQETGHQVPTQAQDPTQNRETGHRVPAQTLGPAQTQETGHQEDPTQTRENQVPAQSQFPRFSRISLSSDDDDQGLDAALHEAYLRIAKLQEANLKLQGENTGMLADWEKANFKYATVVEFAAHQFRVMSILSTHLSHLGATQDKREKRELSRKINEILGRSEEIMTKLNSMIPGIDRLISSTGKDLNDWIEADEHFHAP